MEDLKRIQKELAQYIVDLSRTSTFDAEDIRGARALSKRAEEVLSYIFTNLM